MSRIFRVYKPFANAGLQEALTYKMNFICYILGDILMCFINFFLWSAIFSSKQDGNFMGFSQNDMTLYIFISFLTSILTYSDGAYVVGEEIRDGNISMRIIKPVNFDITFLFQELGGKILTFILVLVPMVAGVEIYRFAVNGIVMFNVNNFIVYLISMCLAYLINFYFNVCYGYSAFVLKNLWGANVMKNVLVGFLSGATIPLAFLPSAIGNVLKFLPFASLSYTPVLIYMGMYSTRETVFYIGLQIIWIAVFYVLQKIIWNACIKRVSVQGG